jgi:tripartite-type tricarboxylate transporter receptor subunit TctC
MPIRRRFLHLCGAAAVAQPWAVMAQAGRQPGVVRLLVGFPPGATGDRIARAVAPSLESSLRTGVIVDNKAGAAGQLAIEFAKAAPHDGGVLLQTIGSSMVIYPHTYRNLRYKPLEDFIPVGTVATAPIAFVAAANVPVRSVGEVAALLRQDRKQAFFGSPAAGSVFQFSGVLMQRSLGSEFSHVAYKGSAPLLNDVLAGQIPFAFMAPSDVLEHHRAGKLRVLAVTGNARASQLPDVPAFPEAGFKDLVNREWFSYFLAAGTSSETVARYVAAVREAVASREVVGKLQGAGLEIGEGDPVALAATMEREYGQWRQIVKEIGFVAD